MMEASAVGFGWVEVLLLLFGGQFLGMAPGERDPQLIKSPPATAYFYQEWTGLKPDASSPAGLPAMLADEEIQHFVTAFTNAHLGTEADPAGPFGTLEPEIRANIVSLLSIAVTHPGCVYLAGTDNGEQALAGLPLQAAAVLNPGNDAERFMSCLNRFLKDRFGVDGVEQPQLFPLPGNGPPIVLHRVGSMMMVGVGTDTIPQLLVRLEANEAEINRDSAYQAAVKSSSVEHVGNFCWMNLQAVQQDLLPRLGVVGTLSHGVWQALGLDEVHWLMSTCGTSGSDVICETQVRIGNRRQGLLNLLNGRSLKATDVAAIPADADFVAAISLDSGRVLRSAREIVGTALPEAVPAFDEFQKQLEIELKLNANEITEAFGDAITIYDAPSTGGLGATGLIVSFPVRAPARAASALEQVRQLIVEGLHTPEDDSVTTLAELNFGGHQIHYLNTSGYAVRYNGHSPFSPAFCLTDDALLVALHPQAIKAHLRFVKSSQPRLNPQSLAITDGEVLGALMVDTPRIASSVYPLIPLAMKATLAEQQADGSPLKLGDLPSAAAILPYLRPATMSMMRRDDRLMITQRNMVPLIAGLVLAPRILSSDGMSLLDQDEMLEGRQPAPAGAPAVDLGNGTGGGVEQAKVEQPAPPDRKLTAVERAALKAIPGTIRSSLPLEIQQFIPEAVIQKISEETTPERIEERRAERERRRAERAARRAARRLAP